MADKIPLKNSAGNAVEFVAGDTLGVANGGMGTTALTSHGVVIGNGTGAVNTTAAGTAGQPLVSGGASADPSFSSSFIGKSIAIYKSADESVTSSSTLQNDDDFSFAIRANEVWKGSMLMTGSALGAGGIKGDFTIPSGASGSMTSASSQTGLTFANVSVATGFGLTVAMTSGRDFAINFTITNGANAGTVQFRFAQNVSNGTATIIKGGSLLHATRTA